MENAGFPSTGDCGEEIERALMDLGPLLGVSIKEEITEELGDGSSNSGAIASGAGVSAGCSGDGAGSSGSGDAPKAEGEGADSLASPTAQAAVSAARCAFCHALLAHTEGTPKLMECLHSACDQCVKAKIEEKLSTSRDFLGAGRVTVTCAECRLQCQPANMIDQRFVLEKMALEQAGGAGGGAEQQCSSCGDTEPATSYCVDCAEFICDSCVSAHQRLKITKEHTIKSRTEALSELQAAAGARAAHDMFCRDHPQERLALFCETCDRLTCRDCQLQHHRDHKYQFSTEMAAQARSSIAALLSEVSYKRVLLGSAMKVIRDRQALIADKKKALVHEITQTVVKLTNAINTRGKQLVLRLNEVCDGKQRTLAEKKEALEQLAAITDHCVRFVGAALDQGSDTAVLYSKRAVCAHLQRIKSRRADIPNPEIPVRISLALDKLPDLLRVLSSIGAIVVDGKVDGGAANSPGPPPAPPYMPPAVPHAPHVASHPAPHNTPHNASHNTPHSAVAALQHVAMHQSYAAAASAAASAAGGYLARGAARALTPLRHPHVTSTTHPHHLHGMSELNLRGLLNAGGRPTRPPHPAHPYQHMMGAYASGSYGGGRAAQRRPAHALAAPRAAARQVAHPAARSRERGGGRGAGRGRRGGGRGVQDHAGPPARAAARRHLHQPQDAQPQPQWRRYGAGQGVRGVGAGPHGDHRQAGLQRRAGGGGDRPARRRRARAAARLAGARALVHGRAPPRRPQRGLVRSVHGRRRAHVLRPLPQGLPPVLPHSHHREAARRVRVVAVPAVRELRGAAAGAGGRRGRADGARAAAGGARDAGAVLSVRAVAAVPRARAAAPARAPPHVSGRRARAPAAHRRAPLHRARAVRRRRAPHVPERLYRQSARHATVQGRQAAGGVLRRPAAQVAAGVRAVARPAQQAAPPRLTRPAPRAAGPARRAAARPPGAPAALLSARARLTHKR